MQTRAMQIGEKIRSFGDELIAFIENVSDGDWSRVCDSDQWTVGVTAYHIGASHFALMDLVGMIVRGQELPQLNMDQIHEMSRTQAREHAGATKAEAIGRIVKNRDQMVAFISRLSDRELERKASMPAMGEVTAEQLIDRILFGSGRQHFETMKSALKESA